MSQIELSETLNCYSIADIRALEAYAIEKQGVPAIQLMKNAGRAAFDEIKERWPEPETLHIFCGGGNNGGDGFIVAGLAADSGWDVRIVDLSDPSKMSDEAAAAREFALQRTNSVVTEVPDLSNAFGIVVDALLGIGFSGELRGAVLQACRAINQSWMPVFALDVPSGVNADTGACAIDAVGAEVTISFIAAKRGLLTGAAENCVGELVIEDLGVNELSIQTLQPHEILTEDLLDEVFPRRFPSAHKGAYGHLLIVGGNTGMSGAAILASEAALALGVGKISVATREPTLAPLLARIPEAMAHRVDHYNDLEPLLNQCTAVVVGPGLGKDSWAEQMLLRVMEEDIPLVVDADAINLIAEGKIEVSQERICFTPHPGEAAKVLGISASEVQENRFVAIAALEEKIPGHWLLKGNGSLLTRAEPEGSAAYLNITGNPGMASGGMGDVLSGLIGSVLAQGYEVEQSAKAGLFIHGAAADIAAEVVGEISLKATDLVAAVPEVLHAPGFEDVLD
jgi:ADP-dependent NAD(P)H-hydrate dehydratase / NAD(P)H-hydrate epimerase